MVSEVSASLCVSISPADVLPGGRVGRVRKPPTPGLVEKCGDFSAAASFWDLFRVFLTFSLASIFSEKKAKKKVFTE